MFNRGQDIQRSGCSLVYALNVHKGLEQPYPQTNTNDGHYFVIRWPPETAICHKSCDNHFRDVISVSTPENGMNKHKKIANQSRRLKNQTQLYIKHINIAYRFKNTFGRNYLLLCKGTNGLGETRNGRLPFLLLRKIEGI